MTANHPNTANVPNAKNAPRRFLSFSERINPKIARMVTSAKIITKPIKKPPYLCRSFSKIMFDFFIT